MEKRYDEAVASYDQALALDRRNAAGLANEALALVLQGRLEAAEACYREAIAEAPQQGRTMDSLQMLRVAVEGLAESRLTVEVASE